jgi:hypothetical protein
MIEIRKCVKTVITYETDIYSVDGNKNINIYVSKQNNKIQSYQIHCNKMPFKSEDQLDKNLSYYYFDKKIFDEFNVKHFTEIKFNEFIIPFDKFKNEKKLDINRILCPYYGGHMVFKIKDLYPIPTVMYFDYCGGIDNEHYHIDGVLEYLKNNKFVLSVEKEEIPYYNREKNRTHGLKMKVLFSDEVFREMWNYCKKDKYPTVRMKDMVCAYYLTGNKSDPLGIRKFVKSQKELDEQKDSISEKEDYEQNYY